ncbi:MAG: response regulator [Candidatus Odinarchaeota archaeon]
MLVKKQEPHGKTERSEIKKKQGKPLTKILVVDDDPSILELAKFYLEDLEKNFTIETVTSPAKALAIVQGTEYSALVSDYLMPEMDGLELLRAVKETGITIPFFLFTGKGREEVAMDALNLGANGYLMKGGDPNVQYGLLARMIKQEVKSRRIEQAFLEEREKARRYLDVADVILVVLDANGNVSLVNRKGCELLGYVKEEIIGKNWFDHFVPQRLRASTEEFFEKLMIEEIEEIAYHEDPILTRNGEEKIISWHDTVLRDEQGSIISTLSSGMDITEKTRLFMLLKGIKKINHTIIRAKTEDEILQGVCTALQNVFYIKFAWIGLVVEGTYEVKAVAQVGFEEGYLSSVKITWDDSEYGKGPTGTAIKTGKPSIMRNIHGNSEYRPWREQALKRGYASSIALPLKHGTEVIGTLNVYSGTKDAFGHEEVKFLEEVARDISFGIKSLRLAEALKRQQDHLEKLVEEQTTALQELNSQLQKEHDWRRQAEEEITRTNDLSIKKNNELLEEK